MATATLTQPAAETSPVETSRVETSVDALLAFGELYRDEAGHDVWRIRDIDGGIYADGVASDFDAQWLAEQMLHAA